MKIYNKTPYFDIYIFHFYFTLNYILNEKIYKLFIW